VLATRFGLGAVDLVHDKAWGKMVALKCGQIVSESMSVTRGKTRFIDRDLFDDVAKSFFG
jgi:6-phosphofructokinase 1